LVEIASLLLVPVALIIPGQNVMVLGTQALLASFDRIAVI
jgi:hypothetical protein